uniref:Uncharacterized protein n=1 Tax=Glossina austeni TaxID=7395 RepID=A0A1A9UR16_GLOAU
MEQGEGEGEVSEKVGREVFRAVWLLTKCYEKNYVPESKILSHVEGRIKNLVATHHLKNVVHKCLENLSDVGLLYRTDPECFSVIRQCPPKSSPSLIQPDILKQCDKLIKCKRKFSDTNVRRGELQLLGKPSVTNDENDCTTKRLRTNDDDILYTGVKKPFFKICQRCCDNFLNIIYGRNENVDQSKLEISSQSNSSTVETVESVNNTEEISRATTDNGTVSKATSANIVNESDDEQLALSPVYLF